MKRIAQLILQGKTGRSLEDALKKRVEELDGIKETEEMFDLLDCPIVRIGALDTPVPFAPVLEQAYLPNAQDIVKAVRTQE